MPVMEVIPLGFYKKWCIIPLGFYKLITFIPLGFYKKVVTLQYWRCYPMSHPNS